MEILYFLIVLFILLLVPVGISYERKNETNTLKVRLGHFIRIPINYFRFREKYLVVKLDQYRFRAILNNLYTYQMIKPLIKVILQNAKIKKLQIELLDSLENYEIDFFTDLLFFIMTPFLSNYLVNNFGQVNNDRYEIKRVITNKEFLNIEINLSIPMGLLLTCLLLNLKYLFMLKEN